MPVRLHLPLLAASLFLLGAAQSPGQSGPAGNSISPNPFAGKAKVVGEGRQVFLQAGCYNCHGFEATGGGVAPDLSQFKGTDEEMFSTIHNGRPGTLMPAWKSELTDEQIWKLVTYLRSLKTPS